MTLSYHDQRIQQICDEFRSLHIKGELEQHASEPKGGHTRIRFIPKQSRNQAVIRRHMTAWYKEQFKGEEEWVKLDRYAQFTVVRPKCVYCGRRWFEHTPSGGQCLFAATSYKEPPRGKTG